MALKGNIRDFTSFDILELIHLKRKTGILFMTSSENGTEETITLGFENGGLVSAKSTTKRLEIQIGKVLVMTERITETQLEKGLALQKITLEHLGKILCREKFCSEMDISDAIHVQMKKIAFTLLQWEEGTYVFELQDSLEHFYEFVKPLNINRLLMEGAVIMDEWPRIKKVIHSLELVFRRLSVTKKIEIETEDAAFALEEEITLPVNEGTIVLTETEHSVYAFIDGKSSIKNILGQTILSEFACCNAIFELVQKGLIENVSETVSAGTQHQGIETSTERPLKSAGEKSPQKIEPSSWGIASELVQAKFPTALVLGVTLSDAKKTALQGEADTNDWRKLALQILKEVTPLGNGTPVGAFEYIENDIGIVLVWNLQKDYMLLVSTPLIGNDASDHFRAHIVTIVRNIIHRELTIYNE